MSNTPLGNSFLRAPIAAILAWLIPGLGHIFLGHKVRGVIFLVVITLTFWTGVAIGGVQGTVDPKERKLWFIAQLCSAANTLAGGNTFFPRWAMISIHGETKATVGNALTHETQTGSQ